MNNNLLAILMVKTTPTLTRTVQLIPRRLLHTLPTPLITLLLRPLLILHPSRSPSVVTPLAETATGRILFPTTPAKPLVHLWEQQQRIRLTSSTKLLALVLDLRIIQNLPTYPIQAPQFTSLCRAGSKRNSSMKIAHQGMMLDQLQLLELGVSKGRRRL